MKRRVKIIWKIQLTLSCPGKSCAGKVFGCIKFVTISENYIHLVISVGDFWGGFEVVASFSGFTWPKTTLTPETERGLTSEFGMGSGGSRVLWPATDMVCGFWGFLSFCFVFFGVVGRLFYLVADMNVGLGWLKVIAWSVSFLFGGGVRVLFRITGLLMLIFFKVRFLGGLDWEKCLLKQLGFLPLAGVVGRWLRR